MDEQDFDSQMRDKLQNKLKKRKADKNDDDDDDDNETRLG